MPIHTCIQCVGPSQRHALQAQVLARPHSRLVALVVLQHDDHFLEVLESALLLVTKEPLQKREQSFACRRARLVQGNETGCE